MKEGYIIIDGEKVQDGSPHAQAFHAGEWNRKYNMEHHGLDYPYEILGGPGEVERLKILAVRKMKDDK